MKTQAWAWLAAAVLAAGLNASYYDGGLPWAHRITDRVAHASDVVAALASGQAEQFLAEARLATAHNENASCPLATLARAQARVARSETAFAPFEAMPAEQDAQLARLQANGDRMVAQIEAQIDAQVAQVDARTARIRIPAVAFRPVVVRVPQASACPRIRVNLPRAPMVHIPAPVVDLGLSDGPI